MVKNTCVWSGGGWHPVLQNPKSDRRMIRVHLSAGGGGEGTRNTHTHYWTCAWYMPLCHYFLLFFVFPPKVEMSKTDLGISGRRVTGGRIVTVRWCRGRVATVPRDWTDKEAPLDHLS